MAPRARTGREGREGAPGQQGEQGEKGENGKDGAPGQTGEKGDRGPQGPPISTKLSTICVIQKGQGTPKLGLGLIAEGGDCATTDQKLQVFIPTA